MVEISETALNKVSHTVEALKAVRTFLSLITYIYPFVN
jgi:hypothetical protein